MINRQTSLPMVSIVVAAYNADSFIAETLSALSALDYPELEIILVNDGSTDGTLQKMNLFADANPRMKVVTQPNGGVCRARNHGISLARGKYILPVDADDILLPGFLKWAVLEMEQNENIKVAIPKGEFFGTRTGEWKLKTYSPKLLARKNMIPATSLYRKTDWERCGGYNNALTIFQDWQFWIAILKDGGEVITSPNISFRYRISPGSMRIKDRKWKHKLIDVLNERHPEFFQRQLGGPLHYHRSWSAILNKLQRILFPRSLTVTNGFESCSDFFLALPAIYRTPKGEIIYNRRNQLRRLSYGEHHFVVKSYKVPHLLNRLVYGFIRPSKAKRAYEYAKLLREKGIGSPMPVAYYTERLAGLFFGKSYFVSMESECPYTYEDIMNHRIEREDEVLQAIGELTARLHNEGMIHMDYSRGNILIGFGPNGEIYTELIDLNRIRFRPISIEEGLANLFERLPVDRHQHTIMKKAYLEHRNKPKS